MTRLLSVIDSFGFGGAETQLAEVLSVLAKSRGHECLACSLLPRLPNEVEFNSNVKKTYLGKMSRFSLPQVTSRLLRLVKQFRPDVAYSRLPLANGLTRIATLWPGQRTRHVAGVDTAPEMYTAAYTATHPGSLVFRWLERRADRIVCNSEATAAAVLQRGYRKTLVRVVPNGVDVDRFQPPPSRPALPRPRLICIASLRPEKGVDRLLQVLAPTLREQRAELQLVGDGVERRSIERVITTLGLERAVTLVGAQRDVRPFLHASHLFVTAARVEGFGIAAAEAAATGLPTVAFAAPGGLAEVVIDGVTGYLVPAQVSDLFRQRVEELCKDANLRHTMGSAGRAHVVHRFALSGVVQALERCLYEW
jgi:glycosyltransferase involved in cell wall biosynthesis